MKFHFVLIYFVSNVFLSFAFKRVCYLRVDGSLRLLNIPRELCTHIILGFASVSNDSTVVPTNDNDHLFYSQVAEFKSQHPNVRILLSVGGGGNDNGFHGAAENTNSRSAFAISVVNLLKTYSFDGIDIDWEFPVWSNFRLKDRPNFSLLLQTLRNAFDVYQMEIQRTEGFLISVAVSGSFTIIKLAYDPPEMIKYIDFINLMTYDLNVFKWYTPFANHNSPLFSYDNDSAIAIMSTTAWAADYWHDLGVPKDRIMVGIPTYARKYRLAFSDSFQPGTLATADLGDAGYQQICDFLKMPGTKRYFDDVAKVPYAVNEDVWITYEDEESIYYKIMWIKQNNFGGVMTYSLNADDYHLSCRTDKTFVLHSAISYVMTTFLGFATVNV